MGTLSYEELMVLLRQREAELTGLKEERRDKETAIDFLKTKIAKLQNQNRVVVQELHGRGSPFPSEDRDQRLDDLELQLFQTQQELEKERQRRWAAPRNAEALVREIEELRDVLELREREVDSLKWQLEQQPVLESPLGTSSQVLYDQLQERDAEVEDLRRRLEGSMGRERLLQERLEQHAERVRGLTLQLQDAQEEALDLRSKLKEARDEVSVLWSQMTSREDKVSTSVLTEAEETGDRPEVRSAWGEADAAEEVESPEALQQSSLSIEERDLKTSGPGEAPSSFSAEASADTEAEPQTRDRPGELAGEEPPAADVDPRMAANRGEAGVQADIALSLDRSVVSSQASNTAFDINFDGEEDLAAKEAKRQRVARQMEKRRQARRAPSGGALDSSRRSAEASTDEASQDASRPSGRSDEAVRPGEIMEPWPATSSRSPPPSRLLVATSSSLRLQLPLEATKSLKAEEHNRQSEDGKAEPTEGLDAADGGPQDSPLQGSPGVNGNGSSTPTLHSKFAGLRDEMKRRRSLASGRLTAPEDLQEAAEAVIKEAATGQLTPSPPGGYPVVLSSLQAPPGMRSAVTYVTMQQGAHHPFPPSPTAVTLSLVSSSGARSPGLMAATSSRSLRAGTSASPGERVITSSPCHVQPPYQPHSPSVTQVIYAAMPVPAHHHSSPSLPARSTANMSVVHRVRSVGPQDVVTPASGSFPAAGRGPMVQPPQGELDRSRRTMSLLSARSPGTGGNLMSSTGRVSPGQQTERYIRDQDSNIPEADDTLHHSVLRFLCQRPPSRFPFLRLARGVYQFGNRKLVVAMHNDKLMARIGGGFINLESYLQDVEKALISQAPPPPPQILRRSGRTFG